jgi:hypothetical protein
MKIKAYFMEVNENGVVFAGRVGEIENTLEQMQAFIGGELVVRPLTNTLVVVSGKDETQKRPLNRAIVKDAEIAMLLTGNVMCVRQGEHGFASIEDADLEEIRKCLKPAFDLDGQIFVDSER